MEVWFLVFTLISWGCAAVLVASWLVGARAERAFNRRQRARRRP